jgi:site-specific recombinase XerD
MMKFAKGSLFAHIRNYLMEYLPKQRRVSPNTVRSYSEALELLVDFVKTRKQVLLQDVTFEMLTSEMIIEYLEYLEAERGCSVSTRNNRLAAVRAFLKYAADMDVTAIVFLDELKKVPVKKPDKVNAIDYMTMPAVTAVIEQADANTLKGLRDRTFMVLMYDTGARLQEMIDIRLCDLRFSKTSTITLQGKGRKVRSVPLTEKTVQHLQKYLDAFHPEPGANEPRLFYTVSHGKQNPLSASCIRLFLTQYGDMACKSCIEVPENVHPHLFRHSRAMHLYQNGMDLTLIAQWLGHSHIETTRIYAYADTEQKRKAIAAATPPGDPLNKKLSPSRFIVTDEDTLKRLAGFR